MPFKEGKNINDEKCCQLTEIQAAAVETRRLDVIVGRNELRDLFAVATAAGRRGYTCYGPKDLWMLQRTWTNTWSSIGANCTAHTVFDDTVRCLRSMRVPTVNTCARSLVLVAHFNAKRTSTSTTTRVNKLMMWSGYRSVVHEVWPIDRLALTVRDIRACLQCTRQLFERMA
jgi:hypothetical protein